jgi:hypothetical protein
MIGFLVQPCARGAEPLCGNLSRTLRARLRNMLPAYGGQEPDCISRASRNIPAEGVSAPLPQAWTEGLQLPLTGLGKGTFSSSVLKSRRNSPTVRPEFHEAGGARSVGKGAVALWANVGRRPRNAIWHLRAIGAHQYLEPVREADATEFAQRAAALFPLSEPPATSSALGHSPHVHTRHARRSPVCSRASPR